MITSVRLICALGALGISALALKPKQTPRHLKAAQQEKAMEDATRELTSEAVFSEDMGCDESAWAKRRRSAPDERSEVGPVKKILYINIKQSDDRFQHMEQECKQKAQSVPCKRFPAIVADQVNQETMNLYSKGSFSDWLDRAEPRKKNVFAAIHFSNYKVLEHILKTDEDGANGTSIYMVLEDDATISHQWQEQLPQILRHTPANWDMLRIGFWGRSRSSDKVNDYIYTINPPGCGVYAGNTGYLVRPKSIPHILDVMRSASVGSIENTFMYPVMMEDGTEKQVMSYAVTEPHQLIHKASGFRSSHSLKVLNDGK